MNEWLKKSVPLMIFLFLSLFKKKDFILGERKEKKGRGKDDIGGKMRGKWFAKWISCTEEFDILCWVCCKDK